jgi:hypothetical protein
MKTENYMEQRKRLPETGRQVIGRIENNCVIVYQAFNAGIAKYAVKNQKFGGPHYSFNRMSWIKPGFLWMMYRSGWAIKANQEHILAISLPIDHFKTILSQATLTSFDKGYYESMDQWKNEKERTEVRLQWDPDHDPYGNKQERKAIQIGMKGEILKKFCTEWITAIEDITGFVKNEYEKRFADHETIELDVPYEQVIHINEPSIEKRIGITLS